MVSGLSRDFWTFWAGQSISRFGSSVTDFALPLLVYQMTGSALDLGVAFAAGMLPYLLFGLVIGALTDRMDRKRLMIVADVLRAAVIAVVPLAAAAGALDVRLIYVVLFTSTTLTIFFEAAEFGAVPSLVAKEDLVTANGRIQASYSTAAVAGPIAAGALVAVLGIPTLLTLDALSFVASAVSIALIRRPLHGARLTRPAGIRADVAEGLRYVVAHPVLRSISAMMALVNLIGVTAHAQLVLFAKTRFAATDAQVGLLFSAGGVGVVLLSLLAGPLRRRFAFGPVALGALMLSGLCTLAVATVPWYPVAVALWGLGAGLGTLFNINTGSLRQSFVPERLLGRIISVAMVLAWSMNPLGALAGGWLIQRTGDIALVYAGIGGLTFLVPLAFFLFSPLGRAERYLRADASPA